VAERWPKAVVFDLDGTLIDSAGDIADSLNEALRRSGLEGFSDADVRLMVGGGARVLIERALTKRGAGTDACLAQRVLDDFLTVYGSASVARTTVYAHGRKLLDELTARGSRLAICTNKPEPITESVLVKLGLRHRFQAVIGGSDALPKKPHPAMLLASIQSLAVGVEEAVLIGDSSADVGAARAAGMPVIAVEHGYSQVPVGRLGADLVIGSLADVKQALEMLSRRIGLTSR
jgi:phosphoglycolate phosphatase